MMQRPFDATQDKYDKGFEDGRISGQLRVESFHENVVGLAAAPRPHMNPSECYVRARLIAEEAAETVAALIGGVMGLELAVEMANKVRMAKPSLVEYCDGAADLRVVLHGTDLAMGVWGVAEEVFDIVCDSNDAKWGGPKCEKTGKQLKPRGWTPPDIAGLLRERLGWLE